MNELIPHPYQDIDANRIVNQRGTFLCYEAGGGKTITAILGGQRASPKAKWGVICPRNAKKQWREELARWVPGKENVRVTNYEYIEPYMDELLECEYIVLDEGDKTRNEDTQRYGFLHQICTHQNPLRRIVNCTASPVRKGIVDLLPQLVLLGIYDHSQLHHLKLVYTDPQLDGYFGKLDTTGASNIAELKAVLDTCMIRRTYSEFPFPMPQVNCHRVPTEIDPGEHGDRYRAAAQDFAVWYKATHGRAVPKMGSHVTKRRLLELAKLETVTKRVGQRLDEGRTALVFTEFRHMAELLQARFPGSGLIMGGDSEGHREETIQKISEGGPQVLFATVSSLDSALNMQAANYVGYPGWGFDPMTFNQTAHRVWRQKQEQIVDIDHFYMINDPLQTYIKDVNERREDFLQMLGLQPTLSVSHLQIEESGLFT